MKQDSHHMKTNIGSMTDEIVQSIEVTSFGIAFIYFVRLCNANCMHIVINHIKYPGRKAFTESPNIISIFSPCAFYGVLGIVSVFRSMLSSLHVFVLQ